MALVAHQPQGVYLTSSSRRFILSKRMQLKRCLTKHHMIGRTDWHGLLKRNISSSVGSPLIRGSTHKPLRIAAFKGNAQNDESITIANGLKVPKTSVGLEESGEAKSESPKVHNVPLSYASKENDSLATSPAIHKLFKKWLTMLRTQSSTQEAEKIMEEPPLGVSQETLQEPQNQKRGEVLKVAWSHFVALDATIKIPLLIFVPFYLAVNVIHGAEISRELTPLWVLGPLIVAFYITILRKLYALYVFSFKQTVKVLKSMPSFCILAFSYVFCGKLKEDIGALILQPVMGLKNKDYKELRKRKFKELEEWLLEKYIDFVESIWPYYCRTIRFLKRANLI
ncbi:uncharacterized protein LOC129319346 isoform X2 [Prosopis cineraria]|uniref:uncharacterized protein LOC129319346 isoform X2 n=1 Tax=Prosopis cineraria TaxID=364024 RepID=UPI00240F05C8|nr:uncharacterized protein LOC129319346 isoform X2 [Prosopis cineraria]